MTYYLRIEFLSLFQFFIFPDKREKITVPPFFSCFFVFKSTTRLKPSIIIKTAGSGIFLSVRFFYDPRTWFSAINPFPRNSTSNKWDGNVDFRERGSCFHLTETRRSRCRVDKCFLSISSGVFPCEAHFFLP